MPPQKMDNMKVLPIEKVQVGTLYTITVAPSNDHQKWDESERVREFTKYYKTYVFKQLLPNSFAVMIEISSTGRLHFHGSIKFVSDKEILKFYTYTIHNLLRGNQIEIDTIADLSAWETYCNKQSRFKLGSITSQEYSKLERLPKVQFLKISVNELEDKDEESV